MPQPQLGSSLLNPESRVLKIKKFQYFPSSYQIRIEKWKKLISALIFLHFCLERPKANKDLIVSTAKRKVPKDAYHFVHLSHTQKKIRFLKLYLMCIKMDHPSSSDWPWYTKIAHLLNRSAMKSCHFSHVLAWQKLLRPPKQCTLVWMNMKIKLRNVKNGQKLPNLSKLPKRSRMSIMARKMNSWRDTFRKILKSW